MEPRATIERRKILEWFAKGAVVATSGAADFLAGLFAAEAIPHLAPIIHAQAVDELGPIGEAKDMLQKLFFGTRQNISLIPAQHNPAYTPDANLVLKDPSEVYTRTTFEVARKFGGLLEQTDERIRRVDQLLTVRGYGNLITFGSPTSNLTARIAMRYTEIGNGNSGLVHELNKAFHLPYLYELDGECIVNSGLPHSFIKRTVKGKEDTIPNWAIRQSWIPRKHGGPDVGLMIPELNENKGMMQDYLLITNLPNMLNLASLAANHRIINFGGTHREGTQAVTALFANDAILKELCNYVDVAEKKQPGHPLYWQALILVNCGLDGDVSLSHIMGFKPIEVHMHKLEQMVSDTVKELQQRQ